MLSPERCRKWLRAAARRLIGTEHPQSTSDTPRGHPTGDGSATTTAHEEDESHNGIEGISPTTNHRDSDSRRSAFSQAETHVADTAALTCQVCAEVQSASSFPHSALITAQCDHPARTCLACVQTWIQTQLFASNDWTHLVCPECRAPMTRNDVQRYATPKSFAKYEAAVRERPTPKLSSPLQIKVAAPTQAEAKRRAVDEQRKRKLEEAPETGQRKLQEALEMEQTRLEREEARRQKPANLCLRWKQERDSRRTIRATTRECPNTECRVRIEKNDGW